MAKLLISFEKTNVRLGTGRWLFDRAWSMRFEWMALMAYKRVTSPSDQAWVTLDEIAGLPTWGGKSRHHIGTNVGRYLRSAELTHRRLVAAQSAWAGPYQLTVDGISIEFDIPILEVPRRLQLRPLFGSRATRDALLQFTASYVRAQWLIFRGILVREGSHGTKSNAYKILMAMAANRLYGPTLQLLAMISAVEVLYRLGRFEAARRTLLDNIPLSRKTPDASLRARFHLKLAWAYQRASTGKRSDVAVEAALRRASYYAQNSGDRATLGLLAQRTAGYLTKKKFHVEAVNQLILALEADLITGNYDNVQVACGNIGSVIHRMGSKHYAEARRWLLLSIAVARSMRLGRDDAHAEMILGKIYIEQGEKNRSRSLLGRAQRIAELAGNRVNLADIKMVWGFWYERFGSRDKQIETLASALRMFREMSKFDARQKEKYMDRSFPSVWQDVLALEEARRKRNSGISQPAPPR